MIPPLWFCRVGLHWWRPWVPSSVLAMVGQGWRIQRSRRCRRCDRSQVYLCKVMS